MIGKVMKKDDKRVQNSNTLKSSERPTRSVSRKTQKGTQHQQEKTIRLVQIL